MMRRRQSLGWVAIVSALLLLDQPHAPLRVRAWQNWTTGWCHDQHSNFSIATGVRAKKRNQPHFCDRNVKKFDEPKTTAFRDVEDPGTREGHTMLIYNDTKVFVFGGRTNNVLKEHRPKSFAIEFVQGKLVFTTYDQRELTDCEGVESDVCAKYPNVEVAVYLNDLWMYDLDCFRFADFKCEQAGWYLVDAGAEHGGCEMKNLGAAGVQEVCTHPGERYNHASAMLGSDLVIYGGYSQWCQDYCDDVWVYDASQCVNKRQPPAGNPYARKARRDPWAPPPRFYDTTEFPGANLDPDMYEGCGAWHLVERGTLPGKRWRAGVTSNQRETMWIFGGHRLWHGFAQANSALNDWADHEQYPEGGYLDDFWKLTWSGKNSAGQYGSHSLRWLEMPRLPTCGASGVEWNEKFKRSCIVIWPLERAGHQLVLVNNSLYMHGGYRVFFPYPGTAGPGAKSGVGAAAGTSFKPYPVLPSYMDDMWRYDIPEEGAPLNDGADASDMRGFWGKITPSTQSNPGERMAHTLVHSKHTLILFGGYVSNHFYDDVWFYTFKSNRWLQKKKFVHPLWPDTCFKDKLSDKWADHESFPYPTINNGERSYMGPDGVALKTGPPEGSPEEWKVGDDWRSFVGEGCVVKGTRELNVTEQYFPPMDFEMIDMITRESSSWPYGFFKYCDDMLSMDEVLEENTEARLTRMPYGMSVWGEPGRGQPNVTDHMHGRLDRNLFILQPRRQSPDWDGCRDRNDGRTHLPNKLLYLQPEQRWNHRAVYSDKFDAMYMFGGRIYTEPGPRLTNRTLPQRVKGDFWQYDVNNCVANCSLNGDCIDGKCRCYDGWYGADCSNVSCPGDYKYINDAGDEVIKHCCHAKYKHFDGEKYLPDERKVRCDANHEGESHGICDGFGHCQCTPPFIGDDCSIRDCPDKCNNNGYCSVEYPVSRCKCDPGFVGVACDALTCLNNCSYPKGRCVTIEMPCKDAPLGIQGCEGQQGEDLPEAALKWSPMIKVAQCNCSYINDPYNNTRFIYDTSDDPRMAQYDDDSIMPTSWPQKDGWHRYGGIDCSYQLVVAAAPGPGAVHGLALGLLVLVSARLLAMV